MKINTDTRRIKRLNDNHFTVLPRGEVGTHEEICNSCGIASCKIRDTIKGKLASRVGAAIYTCADFVPVISFSVTEGLDLDEWNTIRLGEAWMSRVTAGDEIAVFDKKQNLITRRMKVGRLYAAPLMEIAEVHAENNHAMLARGHEGSKATSELMRVLRNAYGSNFAAADRKATAIYVRAP